MSGLKVSRLPYIWRDSNPDTEPPYGDQDDELAWRVHNTNRLSGLHTPAHFADMTLVISESLNADLAMELECEHFKWKWEAYSLGPRISLELLSKHLIMPLISTVHLAFASADPVSELSQEDLQNLVDKAGKTARRTVDTHVKHALSNPRTATTLRRMTALFNFVPSLPPITLSLEKLDISRPFQSKGGSTSKDVKGITEGGELRYAHSTTPAESAEKTVLASQGPGGDSGSETEPESEEEFARVLRLAREKAAAGSAKSTATSIAERGSPVQGSSRQSKPAPSASAPQQTGSRAKTTSGESPSSSDAESSPHRPKKKAKAKAVVQESSSDAENSEEERRKRLSKIVSGEASRRGGARQPLKRGGKRF
ncbi:hypothetical protein GLOTRDRAFT_122033 [Gloeophyllum trabeum ATCC 11539]|uniref:Uncharacterized protein n=1 Tax=Gloeophyllum trabeum (strain ATCC 11539 / FP-39264 / Madison 617) TaxID=670483 RepID=S7Q406_GLOTA|nr:uncharacterized protein GLOTRDRAFT_122033 [Gloeophyllum trabeum ATCC 11539]EPQ54257.1 hypothetical protein GLOTRDRAFT_122033 [Gloeophyllum trabeum ATCC 11539]